jgi:hypothetical protein
MSKRKKGAGKITQSGNLPRPGQKGPATIILTQPRRFGIDIADYMLAVRAFENVDYSRRFRLYDLFSDILMDTHLTSVIEKRKNAALASSIEFRRNGKPDEKVNKQIRSPWFRKFIGDILDAKFWGFSLVQFYRKGEWVNYDPIPGETFTYPEFKGYFANVKWMTLTTSEGKISIVRNSECILRNISAARRT